MRRADPLHKEVTLGGSLKAIVEAIDPHAAELGSDGIGMDRCLKESWDDKESEKICNMEESYHTNYCTVGRVKMRSPDHP